MINVCLCLQVQMLKTKDAVGLPSQAKSRAPPIRKEFLFLQPSQESGPWPSWQSASLLTWAAARTPVSVSPPFLLSTSDLLLHIRAECTGHFYLPNIVTQYQEHISRTISLFKKVIEFYFNFFEYKLYLSS